MQLNRLWCGALLLSALMTAGCQTTDTHFQNWPAGTEPQAVGRQLAKNFLARGFRYETDARTRYVIYPEICAWYGSLQVAELIQDKTLEEQLVRKFDYFLTAEGETRVSQRAHVDYRIFGAVPLEIYRVNQQAQYLQLGKSFAERQWDITTPDGISAEARYWSDDLYMLPLIQVQAYRTTQDRKYLDRAALTMVAYLEKLQQPNGLFLHSTDSPFYWLRGNGWVAAGMTEVLLELPENSPYRPRILDGYRRMLSAALAYQTAEGLWRQLIDQPDFWLETSGTGMFAFAMVTGVKQGWLDANTFGPAARKAWLGLVAHLDDTGNVREVSIGTNKASREVGNDPATQRQYYLDRPRATGDLHGQASILWTATALLRPPAPQENPLEALRGVTD